MPKALFLSALFFSLLCSQALAANPSPDVDARTDSALASSKTGAFENAYNDTMDWSSAAAGAPAQGRVFEADKPVQAANSALERGGESLIGWSSETAGNKNPANKPQGDLPRHAVKMKGVKNLKPAKKSAKHARAQNESEQTRALNLAQQERKTAPSANSQRLAPAALDAAANPIIIRDANGDVLNAPVAGSSQYDPENKPVIVLGARTAASKSQDAPLLAPSARTLQAPQAPRALAVSQAPQVSPAPLQAATLSAPQGQSLAAPSSLPVLAEAKKQPAAAPQDLIHPAAQLQQQEPLAPVPAITVEAPRTNLIPTPEAPVEATSAPAQQAVKTAASDKKPAGGLTTPRIGAITRTVTPSSPIGLY